MNRLTTPALLLLALNCPVLAAPRHEEMDYGRFFSASYNNTIGRNGQPSFEKKGCATNKGIAVKLGAGNGEGGLLFDTDLLRMSGGWTGGFIRHHGVVFDGEHGPNPQPATDATMVFETNPQSPGWSKGPDFTDPRKLPTGPGAAKVPFGPLPKDWARYKGSTCTATMSSSAIPSAPLRCSKCPASRRMETSSRSRAASTS